MGLNDSAKIFAAGDFGGRIGQLDAEAPASQLSSLSNRLTAEHVAILGLLPNARLNLLYGTSAPKAGDDAAALCPECAIGWRVLLNGKAVHETVEGRPMLAVAVPDPSLPGFPGVMVASRPVDAVAFNARDVEIASEQAQQIGRRLSAQRHPTAPCGVILLDAKLNSLVKTSNCLLDELDPKVRAALLEDAKARFGKKPKRTASRIRVRDSRGAFQNFRVELRRNLPTADGADVLAYTMPPRIESWGTLEESSFSGDPETQRLIPALKFMINKFASLPGLPQIAQKAKLSPFHFHREFSARLGISPKHLMLDCQIEHASEQLLRGDVELVAIARSCGFAHQSHFTSRFKQATGLTPTAWRKAMRAKQD